MGNRNSDHIGSDDEQVPRKDNIEAVCSEKLYFYLAVLLYNLWVMLNYRESNYREGRIVADSLKLYTILALTLSFILDIEGAG